LAEFFLRHSHGCKRSASICCLMQQAQKQTQKQRLESLTAGKPQRGYSARWSSGGVSEIHGKSAAGMLHDNSDMLRRMAQLEEQVRRRCREVGELRVVISTKDDIIRSLGAKLEVAESATEVVRAKDKIIRELGLELSSAKVQLSQSWAQQHPKEPIATVQQDLLCKVDLNRKVAISQHLRSELHPPTMERSTCSTLTVSGSSAPITEGLSTDEQPSSGCVGTAQGCDNSISEAADGGASSTAEVAVQTDKVNMPSSESSSCRGACCSGNYCSVDQAVTATDYRACRATLPTAFDGGLFTVLPVSPDAMYFPSACSIVDQRIAAFLNGRQSRVLLTRIDDLDNYLFGRMVVHCRAVDNGSDGISVCLQGCDERLTLSAFVERYEDSEYRHFEQAYSRMTCEL